MKEIKSIHINEGAKIVVIWQQDDQNFSLSFSGPAPRPILTAWHEFSVAFGYWLRPVNPSLLTGITISVDKKNDSKIAKFNFSSSENSLSIVANSEKVRFDRIAPADLEIYKAKVEETGSETYKKLVAFAELQEKFFALQERVLDMECFDFDEITKYYDATEFVIEHFDIAGRQLAI